MTKIKNYQQPHDTIQEQAINNNTSNEDNTTKIKKEHKKSRIVDAEKKLAELEQVFSFHYLGREA